MRVLLDTVTFLWAVLDDPRLSDPVRAILDDSEHEVLLSVVSGWEIAIKHGIGKLDLPDAPDRTVPRLIEELGVEVLPLGLGPVLRVGRLPGSHDDPFDRMLVCQAIEHGLTILTPDEAIRQYPVPTLW